jgi:hypothetical protein
MKGEELLTRLTTTSFSRRTYSMQYCPFVIGVPVAMGGNSVT